MLPSSSTPTTKGVIIKTNEIPAGGLDLHFSEKTKEFNGILFDLIGSNPSYEIDISLSAIEKIIQLKGTFSGKMNFDCSRCAEDFSHPYFKSFTILFHQPENKFKDLSAAVNTGDDADSSFEMEFLRSNDLDLGEVIHEQFALEIPFQPLCSEDCLGLCAQCGTNLNEEPCQCESLSKVSKSSPFAKLKSLTGESNGSSRR